MSNTFTQIHPQAAQAILEQIDEHGHVERRLYKVIYLSKIHPNPENLDEVALVKVELYGFGSDLESFRAAFYQNVPELYPVLFVASIGPLQPDIPEDGMLAVSAVNGPGLRAV